VTGQLQSAGSPATGQAVDGSSDTGRATSHRGSR